MSFKEKECFKTNYRISKLLLLNSLYQIIVKVHKLLRVLQNYWKNIQMELPNSFKEKRDMLYHAGQKLKSYAFIKSKFLYFRSIKHLLN